MDFIFKVRVKKSRTRTSLISWTGGGFLSVSVQNILYCIDHITGGHQKYANFFVESFFDITNDLDPDKKHVDLHMFDGARVCRMSKKY